MTDRAAALVRDIEAIPDVYGQLADHDGPAGLQAALDLVLGRAGWAPRRIVLTGLGSSRFAALEFEARFAHAGVQVVVEPATTDIPVAPSPDCLLVGISSSGSTAEVVAAAERHRGTSRVLAVTRDATSRLAAAADSVVVLPVPAEESGVATTTYVATIALLLHLASALGGAPSPSPELAGAARAAHAVLASRDAWLPATLEVARSVEAISVLTPWSERGTAEQIALLLREAPRRSADVTETAEWLHVGIYTALPGSLALVLAGSPADEEVAHTIGGRSGQVIAVERDGLRGPFTVGPVIPSPARLVRVVGPALLAAELWRAMPGPLG